MVDIKNLQFSYTRSKDLFRSLSLSLEDGHIAGLLGMNGEGKTTLLKLLSGQFLRESGMMNVMGEDPSKRRVSFLSDVFYLPEVIRVPKGCSIGRYFDSLSSFYPNFSKEVAGEAMAAFELTYDMRLDKLSQGWQKKAIIAFALSLGTKLLLLDEPTNGLDIPAKSVFRRLLVKYASEDRTVIISTHQVRDLEQITDYLIVMRNNGIILSKPVFEITEHFTIRMLNRDESALFEERTPGGRLGLLPKEAGDEEGYFSTEFFFNALMARQDEILKILK